MKNSIRALTVDLSCLKIGDEIRKIDEDIFMLRDLFIY